MSIYDQIARGTGGQLTANAMNKYTMQRQQAMDAQAQANADREYGLQEKVRAAKEAKNRLDIIGKMAVHLKSLPEDQKSSMYKRQLGMLQGAGFDTSKFPQEYQPGMEDLAINDAVKYGKQLQYYIDSQGNLKAAQVSEIGGATDVPAPGGGSWVKPPKTVDLGGQVVTMPYGSAYPSTAMKKTLPPAQEPGVKAAQTRATKTAETEVKKAANKPKASAALATYKRKTEFVLNNLEKAKKLIGTFTVGYGEALSGLPATKARRLASLLKTVKANVGFRELQEMRANSPTGGALGQVSERENDLLQAQTGDLDQKLSAADLLKTIESLENQLAISLENTEKAFNEDYGDQAPTTNGWSIQKVEP